MIKNVVEQKINRIYIFELSIRENSIRFTYLFQPQQPWHICFKNLYSKPSKFSKHKQVQIFLSK